MKPSGEVKIGRSLPSWHQSDVFDDRLSSSVAKSLDSIVIAKASGRIGFSALPTWGVGGGAGLSLFAAAPKLLPYPALQSGTALRLIESHPQEKTIVVVMGNGKTQKVLIEAARSYVADLLKIWEANLPASVKAEVDVREFDISSEEKKTEILKRLFDLKEGHEYPVVIWIRYKGQTAPTPMIKQGEKWQPVQRIPNYAPSFRFSTPGDSQEVEWLLERKGAAAPSTSGVHQQARDYILHGASLVCREPKGGDEKACRQAFSQVTTRLQSRRESFPEFIPSKIDYVGDRDYRALPAKEPQKMISSEQAYAAMANIDIVTDHATTVQGNYQTTCGSNKESCFSKEEVVAFAKQTSIFVREFVLCWHMESVEKAGKSKSSEHHDYYNFCQPVSLERYIRQ
ncbi:MAG: hypothetical protein A3I05_04795 [Deltaproteobacteria bacterium RIFCSPLOWO2_02_FULL_44_10]|nr:MAG: hypothetical protein A3C46_00905 [Deltaproteobacteria bacterium RIFCSPHIGHO2_02_FULL_44_16]OGQ45419.1 MAG: hypothetical protein A3I05_04795 [Deltaproteobacteria bacterium RIFCSPLOWO2_02_FULL_44_10]